MMVAKRSGRLDEQERPLLREYDDFANSEFQVPLIQTLLDWADLRLGQVIVDLGCGTGAITRAILDRLRVATAALGTGIGHIYAVDPEPAMVERARASVPDDAPVSYVVGSAEELDQLVPSVDRVLFCNAIHLVEDKVRAIKAIYNSLHTGGLFALNTTYFLEHRPEGTERFYQLWMRNALKYVKEQHPEWVRERRAAEDRPLKPFELLGQQEYINLLRDHGFRILRHALHEVQMPVESFVDIAAYSRFVEGAGLGAPLEWAAAALQYGARAAYRVLGWDAVPRYWLQIVAQRP